jgi:hypothetical protein
LKNSQQSPNQSLPKYVIPLSIFGGLAALSAALFAVWFIRKRRLNTSDEHADRFTSLEDKEKWANASQ